MRATIGEIQSDSEKLLLYHWSEMKKLSSCIESNDPVDGSGEFQECSEYTGLDRCRNQAITRFDRVNECYWD